MAHVAYSCLVQCIFKNRAIVFENGHIQVIHLQVHCIPSHFILVLFNGNLSSSPLQEEKGRGSRRQREERSEDQLRLKLKVFEAFADVEAWLI